MAAVKKPLTVVRRAAVAPSAPSGQSSGTSAQTRPPALDAIDLTIIKILQNDGRAAFTAIAKQLGISEGAVRPGVRSMKSLPSISGSYAAQGTMIVASLALPTLGLARALRGIALDRNEAAIGVSELPNSAGLIVRVLAADGAALARAMSFAWGAARLVLKGAAPAERRK